MGFFTTAKDELSKFMVLVEQMKARMDATEQRMSILNQNVNSLRGLMNRKLGNYEEGEQKEVEKDVFHIFR